MIPEGLEYWNEYRIDKDGLVDITDIDTEDLIGLWCVYFDEKHISLYGVYNIHITGTVGDFHVDVLNDQDREVSLLYSLGYKFAELLNYHIRNYTIDEFVTVFNYMIESLEDLSNIIEDYKIKGMPSSVKRAQ